MHASKHYKKSLFLYVFRDIDFMYSVSYIDSSQNISRGLDDLNWHHNKIQKDESGSLNSPIPEVNPRSGKGTDLIIWLSRPAWRGIPRWTLKIYSK